MSVCLIGPPLTDRTRSIARFRLCFADAELATPVFAGYVYVAVDTLGHLLVPHIAPANEQERAQVADER